MALRKAKKKKKVTKNSTEEVEEVTPEETVDSQPEEDVPEKKLILHEAVLMIGQSYGVGGLKFRRGSPQVIKDPVLAETLRANSAFSVRKL